MGSLALRPGDSLTILEDGFVNRLQDTQFPSCLLFKLRGLGLLPRWDSHPLVDASLHWTHTFQEQSGWTSDSAIFCSLTIHDCP